MSYIGNTNTTQGFIAAVDFFSGNGSTVAFTLSRPVASVAQVQATISNVPQSPGNAYTVSGNTITFTSAPPSGTNNIYVYYTSPITQVIAPGQGTVGTTQLQNGLVGNFAAGSAASPSITNDGDTNTGIFFPAADTIAFSEGGVEAMRINSIGNLLLATTANNLLWFNDTTYGNRFLIEQNGAPALASYVTQGLVRNTNDSEATILAFGKSRGTTAGSATVVSSGDGLGVISFQGADGTNLVEAARITGAVDGTPGANDMPGRLVFSTTADGASTITERMRINSSGQLALGTTTPDSIFGIGNTQTGTRFFYDRASYADIFGGFNHLGDSGGFELYSINNSTDRSIRFSNGTSYAGRTERARFLSNGDFAIGKALASETPSTGSGFGFAAAAADPFFSIVNANASGANACIYLSKRTTGTITVFQTNNGTTSTTVGSISTAASSTAFNTSSDYRLKHDIAPMTGALSRVATLKPVTYKWNVDNSDGEGFIAHELAEVCPQAVNGKKDAVNEDGSINPQGIDTSFLVATLTAAIQEQQAIIQTLTDRITALENK